MWHEKCKARGTKSVLHISGPSTSTMYPNEANGNWGHESKNAGVGHNGKSPTCRARV